MGEEKKHQASMITVLHHQPSYVHHVIMQQCTLDCGGVRATLSVDEPLQVEGRTCIYCLLFTFSYRSPVFLKSLIKVVQSNHGRTVLLRKIL